MAQKRGESIFKASGKGQALGLVATFTKGTLEQGNQNRQQRNSGPQSLDPCRGELSSTQMG